jgi:cell volume regulation protein A
LPKTPARIDVDLPASVDRDLLIYTVGPGSRISLRGVRRLLQLENTSLIGVVRDGRLLRPRDLDRLEPGDSVLVIAPPAQSAALDELFGERADDDVNPSSFGDFAFDGALPVGKLVEFYDLPVADEDKTVALADLVQARIGRRPLVGDRIRLGDIGLVVREMQGERISQVGIELEPRPAPSLAGLRDLLRLAVARLPGRRAPPDA